MLDLNSLTVETKEATVVFPGLDGVEVTIRHISREVSRNLGRSSMVTKIDPKTRQPTSELDADLFLDKLAEKAIKSWTGLKYRHLAELMLVDLSSVEDVEAELPFSLDNAKTLLRKSETFDTWINDMVFSLDSFR